LAFRELDDQDRVLGGEADQHDVADLDVDVVVVAREPDAEERAERDERRAEQHRPRQAASSRTSRRAAGRRTRIAATSVGAAGGAIFSW
jgi:hypothetical protein